MFLRNAWYVGAWSREIARPRLFASTILDESIVLFRKSNGEIAALENACPHRKLPLSMGRLLQDEVQCGYHGMTFNSAGRCVLVPCAERVPYGAQVRSYPAVERYGLVWVWMGDLAKADVALLPAAKHWGDPAWGVSTGESMLVDCNYLYMTDNLLDPSHVAWVHPGSFGNEACEAVPLTTVATDAGVVVSRWMYDTEVAPFYAKFVKFAGRCDRKQEYRVDFPSHAIIRAILTPSGAGGPEHAQHPDALVLDSYNFLTPINDNQTRYYWFQLRNFAPHDVDISAELARGIRDAFEEDRLVLNAVHAGMTHKQTPTIDLPIDFGASRFRRRLKQRVRAEATPGISLTEELAQS